MKHMSDTVASDYHDYLVKYCASRHVIADEAEKHKIVQEVKRHYEEREGGKV